MIDARRAHTWYSSNCNDKAEKMLSLKVNVAALRLSDTAMEFKAHLERNKADQTSQYAALLQAPMSSLVSNASDGADVYSAAILGYN
ncbi:hypothetical protein [Paraburkholderia aspalathi]|uniref:hypothetical protein n=1 Tax=Paraburkholderia aspalathi TaxID=1324617 RepID=UPI00190A2C11|nr:hypothetical protein [Paraburkholderia aspalathi]MBK3843978.1 hypothetical protein [Paraburkholderia aspalathi]